MPKSKLNLFTLYTYISLDAPAVSMPMPKSWPMLMLMLMLMRIRTIYNIDVDDNGLSPLRPTHTDATALVNIYW